MSEAIINPALSSLAVAMDTYRRMLGWLSRFISCTSRSMLARLLLSLFIFSAITWPEARWRTCAHTHRHAHRHTDTQPQTHRHIFNQGLAVKYAELRHTLRYCTCISYATSTFCTNTRNTQDMWVSHSYSAKWKCSSSNRAAWIIFIYIQWNTDSRSFLRLLITITKCIFYAN